jgi:Zn-dependent protease
MSSNANHGRSVTLGEIKGIPVRVHLSFPLLPLYVLYLESGTGANPFISLLFIVAIFGCVLLHELGHSLTARRYGIGTSDITLYPFGGVASLRGEAGPREELLIAAAGPLVNLLIAMVTFALIAILETVVLTNTGYYHLQLFGNINIILAVFNLLPALPMDGGRILRALLALMRFRKATVIASRLSQALSVCAFIVSLYTSQVILGIIAVVVFLGASQELLRASAKNAAHGLSVSDLVKHQKGDGLHILSHATTLKEALKETSASFQGYFPVTHAEKLLGIVSRDMLVDFASASEENSYIASVMERSFSTTSPAESIASLLRRLEQGEAPPFVVLDGDRVLSIIRKETLLDFLLLNGFIKND